MSAARRYGRVLCLKGGDSIHPRLRDGASIGTFTYKGSSEKHYFVENELEERFEISYRVYKELMNADGTHPVHLSKSLVDKMKQEKILTTSRYVFEGIISRFVLIPLGGNIARFQPICRWVNVALPLLATLLFAVAVSVKQRYAHSSNSDLNVILYYMLIIFSLLLHEIGHCISGIAYGYSFTDLGILLLGVLPIGAYVSHEDKQDVNRSSLVQFSLAGIEASVLMAAVCLMLSIQSSPLDTTFAMVANINVFLALLNLLPGSGLDGESALSACLGMEIGEDARKFLRSRRFRRQKYKSGRLGCSHIALYAIYYIASAVVGLLIVADILAAVLEILR